MRICGSDKYRYSISVDSELTWTAVTLVKPILISGKRDKASYNYVRKSTVWQLVRFENEIIYDAIKLMIHAPSTEAHQIILKCELYEDCVTLTEISYKGFVPLTGVVIREDNGALEMTPTEKTATEWMDAHKSDVHDIYREVPGYVQPTTYHIDTIEESYYIPQSVTYSAPNTFLIDVGTSLAAWYNYIDYGTEPVWGYNNWVQHTGLSGSKAYHCIVANGPTLGVYEPGVTPGWEDYWDEFNFANKVYRQICDLPFYAGGHAYIHGNGLFEEGFPAVTVPNTNAGNADQTRWYYPTGSTESGDMTLAGILSAGNTVVSTGPVQKLTNVFTLLLTGSGLTLVSQFFNDATNPVTTNPNHLNYLKFVHNRVVKNIQGYDTKGEMTLDGLLKDLCETFRLSWAIIGTNFYIEHINFFENGFSYSGTPGIYADLTDQSTYKLKYQTIYDIDGSESDNEFKFTLSDAPEKELFHFVDGYDYDGQIKYDSAFAKKGTDLKHNTSLFMTDFSYLLCSPVLSFNDAFCLIACDSSGLIYRRTAKLRWLQANITINEIYRRTETDFPNGDLQWQNLLNDFWDYLTIFKTGAINGKYPSVTFNSSQKIVTQRDIRFPRLSGAYDAYKLITTNFGNGRVESFELDTNTDFIKVVLVYEES